MEDNKRSLYDALTQDGYDLGSYEDFLDSSKDRNNLQNLYDAIKNDYDVGDTFDSFESSFNGDAVKTEPKAEPSETVAGTETNTVRDGEVDAILETNADALTPEAERNMKAGAKIGADAVKAVLDRQKTDAEKMAAKPKANMPTGKPAGNAGTAAKAKPVEKSTGTGAKPTGKPAGGTQAAGKKAPGWMGAPSPIIPQQQDKFKPFEAKVAQDKEQAKADKAIIRQNIKKTTPKEGEGSAYVDVTKKNAWEVTAAAQREQNRRAADVDEFYQQNQLGGILDEEFAKAESRADKVLAEKSPYTDSNDAYVASQMRKETDPAKVIGAALGRITEGEKQEEIGNLAMERLGIGGSGNNDSSEESLTPEERNYLMNHYKYEIQEIASDIYNSLIRDYKAKHGNVATAVMDQAISNSLIGMIGEAIAGKYNGDSDLRKQLRQQIIDDAGTGASIASSIGGLILDAPTFMVSGGVGSIAGKGIQMAAREGLAQAAKAGGRELAKGVAERAAARYIAASPLLSTVTNAIIGGTNFGTFNAIKEAGRQAVDGEFDLGNIGKEAASGFVLGGITGAMGNYIKSATQGSSAGVKAIADIGGLAGEIATFSGAELIEKAKAQGVGIGDLTMDDYTDALISNGGVILGMRLTHPLDLVKGIYNRYSKAGSMNLDLSAYDKEQLNKFGFNPERLFGNNGMAKVLSKPRVAERPEEKGAIVSADVEHPDVEEGNEILDLDYYQQLMTNPDIPQHAKQWLAYMVEGRAYVPGKTFGARRETDENGKSRVFTTNITGEVIDARDFDNEADAIAYEKQSNAVAAFNAASTAEETIYDPRTTLRNAVGEIIKEMNETGGVPTDVRGMVQMMASDMKEGRAIKFDEYRSMARDNADLKAFIDDIESRASAKANAAGDYITQKDRKEIIDEYGIDVDELLTKKSEELTDEEISALNEYGKRVMQDLQLDTYRLKIESTVNEGKAQGADAMTDADATYDVGDELVRAEEALAEIDPEGTMKEAADRYIESGSESIDFFIGLNEDEYNILRNYISARSKVKGMRDGVDAEAANVAEQMRSELGKYVRDGVIRTAEINGTDEFISDYDAERGVVYYFDDNGEVQEWHGPFDPSTISETVVDEAAANAEAQTREELTREVEKNLNYDKRVKTEFVPGTDGQNGTVISTADGDYMCVGMDDDGYYIFKKADIDSKTGLYKGVGEDVKMTAEDAMDTQNNYYRPEVEEEPTAEPVVPAEESAGGAETANGAGTEGTVAESLAENETPVDYAMPMTEKNEPDYRGATPERSVRYIYDENGLEEEDADALVDNNIEAARKKVESVSKKRPKMGTSIAEFNEKKAKWQSDMDEAQGVLDAWEAIKGARVVQKNGESADSMPAEESAGNAQPKAEPSETMVESNSAATETPTAEEGTEEIVPDYADDKPADARSRGFVKVNGSVYRRQEGIEGKVGSDTTVIFGKGAENTKQGTMMLVEADDVQESHKSHGRNPMHFIPEAQPKDRTSKDSITAALINSNPENFKPSLAVGGGTAYTESNPIVNSRGEVIQGNGRVMMLRNVYKNPESLQMYKDYLKEHADEFGINPADVDAMEKPMLVTGVDVDDAEAIRLGQMSATDLESGGIERIKATNTVVKLGDRFGGFVEKLLEGDEEASISQLIDKNGIEALKFLNQRGIITNTQYESAVRGGRLTAEAKNDLMNILKENLFSGAPMAISTHFESVPAAAQKAILANYLRDKNVPKEAGLVGDIREAIMAFGDLMQDKDFAAVKMNDLEGARNKIAAWKMQTNMLNDVQNSEKYSNFALELAARMKTMTQKEFSRWLDYYYTKVGDKTREKKYGKEMFAETGAEAMSKQEAIKQLTGIDYGNDVQGSNLVPGRNGGSQGWERGNSGSPQDREPNQEGGRTAATPGGGVEGTQRQERASSGNTERTETVGKSFKVGDRVFYQNAECEVKGINPDGTLQIATTVSGMGMNMMNLAPEEVRAPGSDESIEYFYNRFADNIKSNNRDDKFYAEALKQAEKELDEYKEKADNGKVTPVDAENIARLIGLRRAIVDRLEGRLKNKSANVMPAKTKPSEKSEGNAKAETEGAKAEEPRTEEPKAESEEDRKKREREAKKEALRAKLREGLKKLTSGLDPESFMAAVELTVMEIEDGVVKFADYCKTMIETIGEEVRPYLKGFYEYVRRTPDARQYAKDMDSTEYVDNFDVENFGKGIEPSDMPAEKSAGSVKSEGGAKVKAEKPKTISDLFNNEQNSVDNGKSSNGGYSENENPGRGEENGQEVLKSESGRAGRLSVRSASNDEAGNQGVDSNGGSEETYGELEPSEKRNLNNNHSERGTDYAPTTPAARYNANVDAIRLSQELTETGQQATPEQKEILRKYSGFGGLGSFLNNEQTSKELKDLVGDDAFNEIALSANDAYYTPAYVSDTMWDIVSALGFKGGNILEGSAGIGNIIGLMPQSISERSNIQAIEKDTITGRILALLYPDAKVDIQGFEETNIPNNSVDLAITNVPFVTGLHVKDTTGDRDLSKRFRNIHDFCIAKNVRKLRQGGIAILITSRGTLDNSKKLRDWVVNEGASDFIGAFRMNNETFGGTPVTSDIIVIRKRVGGVKSPNAINVSEAIGARVAEYETDEVKRKKNKETGEMEDVPVVKPLSMIYNSYFVEHPENIAGEMKFGFEEDDTYRPESIGAYPNGKNQSDMLAGWVESFRNMKEEKPAPTNVEIAESLNEKLGSDVREGSLITNKNGEICVARLGSAVPLGINTNKVKGRTKAECLKDYNAIRKALNDVLDYQAANSDDAGLAPLLASLNKTYDSFVRKYGNINRNAVISFLRNDVDFASIMALENVNETGDKSGKRIITVTKSDVFNRRVISPKEEKKISSVTDGIKVSLFDKGFIDPRYIADKIGSNIDDVRNDILEKELGYEDPVSGDILVSYDYLSGNVREKLYQAEQNNTDGRYDRNIRALKNAIPMEVPPHLIDCNFGSSWIPTKYFADFIKSYCGVECNIEKVDYLFGMTNVRGSYGEKNKETGVFSESFNKWILGTELVMAAMNNKTIDVSRVERHFDGTSETVHDKKATQLCASRISDIKQDFKTWMTEKMQSDEDSAREISRIYNDQFNNFVPKSIPEDLLPEHFDGSVYELNGKPFNLYPHQKKAVIRAMSEPVLFAHEVGTGKTFTLITTAMEMRRLGIAKKPMIVVQNSTVGQFVSSARSIYPTAKILTISDADRNAEGRKNFYAKIKYNDWDMIVVPQSVFNSIPDSKERKIDYIQSKIEEKMRTLDAMESSKADWTAKGAKKKEIEDLQQQLADIVQGVNAEPKKKRGAKDEAKIKENTKVKAEEMLDRKVDDTEDFDSMGIDALLIDEAHEYKKLGFETMLSRVKGVDTAYSQKAQGLYLKVQSVMENNNGHNVVFATGTPISNTAAETYTFLRYLLPQYRMEENGMAFFDDFSRNFGNISQMLEFTTSGKFRENTRFAGYTNLPELNRIWLSIADTVLSSEAADVKAKLPELEADDNGVRKERDIFLPQTKALRSVMKSVRDALEVFENMSGKEKKENSHIPLRMYGIAQKAAIDPRLVLYDAADEPNSKTNKTVEETLRALEDSKDYKGTVAIFCDNYQNKASGFNIYEEVRRKLIEKGVPESQIVVMKSTMSDNVKEKTFDKVNSGEVRVILGSTQLLGVGVNIQERLFCEIHMDVPNRPMDYQQRLGRILRQGNLHKQWGIPVRILRMGVEDSLDVTGYQRLDTKAKIVNSIMRGKKYITDNQSERNIEEDEESFDNVVAQLSGSEAALALSKAERDLRKYEGKLSQWRADQVYVANAIPTLEGKIESAYDIIEDLKQDLAKIKEAFPNGKNEPFTIDSKTFSDTAARYKYIKDVVGKRQNDIADRLRGLAMKGMLHKGNNQFIHLTDENSKIIVEVAGHGFTIETEFWNEYNQKDGKYIIHRDMWIVSPDFHIESRVNGSSVYQAIEDIESIIEGEGYADRIEGLQNAAERHKSELEVVKGRLGKDFEFYDELDKAKSDVEELREKMKAEMAEKEAKYREMDAGIESADIAAAVENEEEGDDDGGNEAMIGNDAVASNVSSEARQLATEAVMQVLNDNVNLDVVMKSQEEGMKAAESRSNTMMEDNTDFSIRREPAPKKTGIGYKVFYRGKDGKLYPPMVANPNGADTPIGVWLNADAAPVAGESKTGRPQVKAGGKGTQGGSGQLAYRPGWHLGEIPFALQFNRKDSEGNRTLFPKDFVWAEVEYADDVDYQKEAESYGYTENGKYRHSYAGLPKVPKDGSYRYRTNPNPETDPWIITGAMKVNRILSNDEVDELVRKAGREPQQREMMQRPDGTVYGWTDGKRIYLTPEGVNPNTPIHEYTHLWAKAVKARNPELWKNVVELMRQLPAWGEVENDANYTNIHGNEDAVASEVLSRFSGERGQQEFEEEAQKMIDEAGDDFEKKVEARSLINRVRNAIKKFWSWVGKNLFRIKSFGSAEEVADRVLYDFVNNTDLKSGEVRPSEKATDKPSEKSEGGAKSTRGAKTYADRKEVDKEVSDFLQPDDLNLPEIRKRELHGKAKAELEGMEAANMDDIERSMAAIEKGLSGSFLTYYKGYELTEHPDVPEAVKDALYDAEGNYKDIPDVLMSKIKGAQEEGESKQRIAELKEALYWHRDNEKEMTLAPEEFFDNGKYVGKDSMPAEKSAGGAKTSGTTTMAGLMGELESERRRNEVAEEWKKVNESDESDGEDRIMFSIGSRPVVDVTASGVDIVENSSVTARQMYEDAINAPSFTHRAAWQDNMLALKRMQEVLEKATGRRIKDSENAYIRENRLSSVNRVEVDDYKQKFVAPILEACKGLCSKKHMTEGEYRELQDYMIAKHGLERNEVFAMRDAEALADERYAALLKVNPKTRKTRDDVRDELYDKFRKKDYSGLTSLTGESDVEDAEDTARMMVDDYESKWVGKTGDLWNAVNAATESILGKQLEGGMITRETYDKVRGMFEYYIPLRGFDEKTAEEEYNYVGQMNVPFNNPNKGARGRKSVAFDPIGNIINMAQSGINAANRNVLVKQAFLDMVENHKSDVASISSVYAEKRVDPTTGAEEWVVVYPDIADSDNAATVARKIEDFRRHMEQNIVNNPDYYAKVGERTDIPLRVVYGKDRNQHSVVVMREGKPIMVTVNGNPAVAQAVNGQTAPEATDNLAQQVMQNTVRWMASAATSRNPEFIARNLARDGIYANTMVWIKESPRYAGRYNRNWGVAIATLPKKITAYNKGRLAEDDPFYLFMKNGGETGYSFLKDAKDWARETRYELGVKRSFGEVVEHSLERWDKLLDVYNRWAEGTSRYAAFLTSMQEGRSIDRAIWDAKQISVNFNKKGGGQSMVGPNSSTMERLSAGIAQGFRNNYMFANAGIQGMDNILGATGRHKVKAGMAATVFMGLGALAPMVAGMLGALLAGDGDDDKAKEGYYMLPDYVRRSNFCFYVGDGNFVTVPLPIELRAVYGLGELMAGQMMGNTNYTPSLFARHAAEQISQIFPIDIMEGGQGFSWTTLAPSYVKPLVEVATNKTWTGYPIWKEPYTQNDPVKYQPMWRRAGRNTLSGLVDATKWLSDVTGGDKYETGVIDFNPSMIQHLFEGYFGGMMKTPNNIVRSLEPMWTGEELNWKTVPLVGGFVNVPTERTEKTAVNSVWYENKETMDHMRYLLKGYKAEAESQENDYDTQKEYADRYNSMTKAENMDVQRLDTWDKLNKDLSTAQRKNVGDKVETEIKKAMNRVAVAKNREELMKGARYDISTADMVAMWGE